MKLGETRHLGLRYYTVEPPYGWSINAQEWCKQTFGKMGNVWNTTPDRWYANNAKFVFRKESDRTLFLLRWA